MSEDDKQELIDLLEEYMWSQTDTEITRHVLVLQEQIESELN